MEHDVLATDVVTLSLDRAIIVTVTRVTCDAAMRPTFVTNACASVNI